MITCLVAADLGAMMVAHTCAAVRAAAGASMAQAGTDLSFRVADLTALTAHSIYPAARWRSSCARWTPSRRARRSSLPGPWPSGLRQENSPGWPLARLLGRRGSNASCGLRLSLFCVAGTFGRRFGIRLTAGLSRGIQWQKSHQQNEDRCDPIGPQDTSHAPRFMPLRRTQPAFWLACWHRALHRLSKLG